MKSSDEINDPKKNLLQNDDLENSPRQFDVFLEPKITPSDPFEAAVEEALNAGNLNERGNNISKQNNETVFVDLQHNSESSGVADYFSPHTQLEGGEPQSYQQKISPTNNQYKNDQLGMEAEENRVQSIDFGEKAFDKENTNYDSDGKEEHSSSWTNVIPLGRIKNGLRVAGEALEPLAQKSASTIKHVEENIVKSEIYQKAARKATEIQQSEQFTNVQRKLNEVAEEISQKTKPVIDKAKPVIEKAGVEIVTLGKTVSERTKPIREKAVADLILLGKTVDERTKPIREDLAVLGHQAKERCSEAYIEAKPKVEEFGRKASQKLQLGAQFIENQWGSFQQNISREKRSDRKDNPPSSYDI